MIPYGSIPHPWHDCCDDRLVSMTRVDDRLVSIDDSVDRYMYVYIKLL